ncbi:unnamed protein product, partial [Lampetra fluviatilis]
AARRHGDATVAGGDRRRLSSSADSIPLLLPQAASSAAASPAQQQPPRRSPRQRWLWREAGPSAGAAIGAAARPLKRHSPTKEAEAVGRPRPNSGVHSDYALRVAHESHRQQQQRRRWALWSSCPNLEAADTTAATTATTATTTATTATTATTTATSPSACPTSPFLPASPFSPSRLFPAPFSPTPRPPSPSSPPRPPPPNPQVASSSPSSSPPSSPPPPCAAPRAGRRSPRSRLLGAPGFSVLPSRPGFLPGFLPGRAAHGGRSTGEAPAAGRAAAASLPGGRSAGGGAEGGAATAAPSAGGNADAAMDLTDGEAASPSTNGKAWGAADSANGEAASPSTNGKAWGAADSANGEAASPSTNGKAWGAADSANGEAASPSTNGKAWGAADSANGEAASPSTDGNAAEAKDSALTSANGSAALAAGSTNGSVAGGARVASARLRPLSRSTPVGLDHVGGRGMGSEGGEDTHTPVHTCTHLYTHTCTHLYTPVHTHLYTPVHTHTLTHTLTHTTVHTCTHLYTPLRVNQEEEEEEGPAPPLGASTASPHLPPTSSPTSTTSSSTTATSSTTSSTSSASSSSTPHADEMRSRVVREIFDTEKHYVAQLGDICEGYLLQCRRRPDLFGVDQLELIFGNLEQLAAFQRNFLAALERRLVAATPHATCVGAVFLQHREGFRVYSAYCNNHHRACAELARLSQLGRYRHFLEACRLRRAMIHIPLGGFLLAPVQRLCRYPLQLAQLVKYTPPEHGDFASVSAALEAMRGVASLINERKRRLESVEHIAGWQRSIVEWQGTDVLERSSLLLHSGELVMQSASRPRPQLRVFFLFDHQLVYCKKDLLRKDLLSYRGRIHTDGLAVEDVPDGKSEELQVCVRHALRVTSGALCEPLLLSARKQSDKAQWLVAFQRETSAVADGDKELGTGSPRGHRGVIWGHRGVIVGSPRGYCGVTGVMGSSPSATARTTHGAATPGPSSSSSSTAPSPAAALKRKPSAFWANLGKLAPFRK